MKRSSSRVLPVEERIFNRVLPVGKRGFSRVLPVGKRASVECSQWGRGLQ